LVLRGLLARERQGRVRDEREEMEEKRRRGEPGPVAGTQPVRHPIQKIVPASLAWLTYPTRGKVRLSPEPGWGAAPRPLL